MDKLYKKLRECDYELYKETIEKANMVIESIMGEIKNGKNFDQVSYKIESFLIERTLQLRGYK